MRLDKYIWCVRLFKTRSLAAKACEADKVRLNSSTKKASKFIAIGDILEIKTKGFWREFEVLEIPKSRLAAKLVAHYLKETTSELILEQIQAIEQVNRENALQGIKGRPTKRDRRDIDKLKPF